MKEERCFQCSVGEGVDLLALILMDPERYQDEGKVPDKRIYQLLCLNCGCALTKYVTDNTIKAVKELRDQMDALYGKSITYTMMPTLKESMQRLGLGNIE